MAEIEYKELSVREYALRRNLQPQLVHYYIRTERLDQHSCGCCGSKVIYVEEADAIFVKKEVKDVPEV